MVYDPNIFATYRAAHELRVLKAQSTWEAEAALQSDSVQTERVALRHRAGVALVVLGHRIGGMPPPLATAHKRY
jgi:hypothetical protein